jgi:hypothetical protein
MNNSCNIPVEWKIIASKAAMFDALIEALDGVLDRRKGWQKTQHQKRAAAKNLVIKGRALQ